MGEPSLPAAAFDHLSRERQLGLLWRLAGPMAGYLDRDDAIEYVAQLSPIPCTPPGRLEARITAGAALRLRASDTAKLYGHVRQYPAATAVTISGSMT